MSGPGHVGVLEGRHGRAGIPDDELEGTVSDEVIGAGEIEVVTGNIDVPQGFKGITFSSCPTVGSEFLKQFRVV